MKNSLKLTLVALATFTISLFSNFSVSAIASGSFAVSDQEVELYVGETKDVTVTVENLAGRFDIYSKNSAIADFADDLTEKNRNVVDGKLIAWLEYGEDADADVVLTIKGNQAGETTILVEPVDVTDLSLLDFANLETAEIKVVVKEKITAPDSGKNGFFEQLSSGSPLAIVVLGGGAAIVVGAIVLVRKGRH